MSIKAWMSWESGVDLIAITDPNLPTPNVIIHVARLVHTPNGSAPSGMIFYMPDPLQPPVAMGFVSHDAEVGAYFGANIFAGTPFENAPVLSATIEIFTDLPDSVGAKIIIGEMVIETTLYGLGATTRVERMPNDFMPFYQQGVEAAATGATLKINGKDIAIILPPAEALGAPPAVWAASGVYSR